MRQLESHLAACRRRGLTVDEDFERGTTRGRRRWRYAIVLALLAAAAFAGMTALRPAAPPTPLSTKRPVSRHMKPILHLQSRRVSV
jgi:hypothetical protein